MNFNFFFYIIMYVHFIIIFFLNFTLSYIFFLIIIFTFKLNKFDMAVMLLTNF